MMFRFPLAQLADDGACLPAYMLPSTKAEARLRLVSSLPEPPEGKHAREIVAEYLRRARSLGPAARKASSSSRHIRLYREVGGGQLSIVPEDDIVTLDNWRVRWEPEETPENGTPSGTLTASGWTRLTDSEPLVQHHKLKLIGAEAARKFLWEKSRINLAALRSFLEFAPEIIPGISRSPVALMRVDHACGSGVSIGGDIAFYDYKKLQDIRNAVDNPAHKAPWHPTAESRNAISTGLTFSRPGEDETALVAYYEGPDLIPLLEAPLAGLTGKDLELQRKAFRHRKSIADLHRKIGENTFDFRTAPRGSAEAFQAGQYLLGLEDEIAQHVAELALCYRDLVQVAARKREEILTLNRRYQVAAASMEEKAARVEVLRDSFKPVSNTVTQHLAPHMTKVPVDLALTRLSKAPGFQVSRSVPNLITGIEREMQLDMVLTDPEPNGLADLQKAARFFFGEDGPAHFPLLFYVALSSDLGTRTEISGVRSFSVADAWQRIRPGAVADIRKDGVESWFKRSHKALATKGLKASDVVRMSLRFLGSIRVPYSVIGPDKGEVPKILTGLLHQTSESIVDRKGRVIFNYAWNPELGELVGGTAGRKPSYMYSNHKALFSYSGRELHTAPALQLTLENMARSAAMRGGDRMETVAGRLIIGRTPKGDDMSLGSLIERLGLYGERGDNLHRRILGALDAVQDTGIVKVSFGASRPNKWEQKVRLEMSTEYRDLYNIEKERQAVADMQASLEKPFAPKIPHIPRKRKA